jgi:hypothetical protein
MNGTAVFGERVVIVEVQSGHVSLKTGRIASTASSHVYADNQVDTVVSGDRPFQPVTESPDEACERSFRVNDIHLLKQQEATASAKVRSGAGGVRLPRERQLGEVLAPAQESQPEGSR